MEYPYLTILEIIAFILILFAAVLILFFSKGFFNKSARFSTVLKVFLLYQLGAILLYLVYPYYSRSFLPLSLFEIFLNFDIPQSGYFILTALNFLFYTAFLFLIFYLAAKKLSLIINWKKSLAVFLIMVFLLFPLLNYFKMIVTQKIATLSIFEKEVARFNSQFKLFTSEYGIQGLILLPSLWPRFLSFEILRAVESGINLPMNHLRDLLYTI